MNGMAVIVVVLGVIALAALLAMAFGKIRISAGKDGLSVEGDGGAYGAPVADAASPAEASAPSGARTNTATVTDSPGADAIAGDGNTVTRLGR